MGSWGRVAGGGSSSAHQPKAIALHPAKRNPQSRKEWFGGNRSKRATEVFAPRVEPLGQRRSSATGWTEALLSSRSPGGQPLGARLACRYHTQCTGTHW